MRIHSSTTLAGALALAGLVSLAGCAPSTSTDAPDAGVERTYSADAIATLLDYTGSTEGEADESLEPMRIGWVNQDTGMASMPELTAQMKSAVLLANSELNGIGGRPIVLETCDVTSEEDGLACGQKFANDEGIVAIGQGNIAVGAASFHSVIDPAGIPIVGALPLGVDDGKAPNGFYLSAGSFSTIPSMTQLLLEHFEAKTVSIISIEGEPISTMIAGQMSQALAAKGLSVSQAPLSMSSTDATASLVASGAADADVIIPLVIMPAQCVAVENALSSLNVETNVLALSACYSAGTKEALGDYPQWTYLSSYANVYVEDPDPRIESQVGAYLEWFDVLDQDMDAVIPLQTMLSLQRHIVAGGGTDATRETIAEAARAWEGPIFMGPPTVAYGQVKMGPLALIALPSLQTRAYHYDGDGAFTDMTDGAWVG